MAGVFQATGALYPGRSVFDLSYSKLFDCDMGQLIPVMCDEVVPGDHFTISNEMVVRMQPMLAPVLHHIYITTHYFFVPYRLLWDDWEDFISGGVEGDYTGLPPLLDSVVSQLDSTTRYSLLDYLGFPTPYIGGPLSSIPLNNHNAPMLFPVTAYNRIYNEYYRDQNLQEEIDEKNITILNRAWAKDYFTSSLPWLQRGTVPALPVETQVVGEFDLDIATNVATSIYSNGYLAFNRGVGALVANSSSVNASYESTPISTGGLSYQSGLRATSTASSTGTADAELAAISTVFNIADLRLAFQISKWQERNARSGVRYTEFLHAHFGVSPRDDRLDRPEYIGGTKSPIVVSEVLQTSSTDSTSPQGNMAGHGITADQTYVGKYHVKEFGLIMGIMSILPAPSYVPQGFDRQWSGRRSRFDFYFREFANLSEQAVLNKEIYSDGTEVDSQVFGFQGRYDELRVKQNMVCAGMKDYFDYWHLSRKFANRPALNESFIRCDSDQTKRIFAVQNEPGLIVHYANKIKAVRPIPYLAEPGLIDHF